MADLRQKYWVICGNATVRSIIKECVTCKRLATHPLTQLMADLPAPRVNPEVLDTMDSSSCINVLRRLQARREQVKLIWSDNGTNTTSAYCELRQCLQELNERAIKYAMVLQGVEWYFNPPHASHFGGVWEREIRTFRHTLAGICNQQLMNDDTLHTFCEVEAIVNSHPLTRVNDDPNCLQPLTPNFMLTLRESPAPVTETDPNDVYARQRWCQVQYLADLFWQQWTKEYLPMLQSRQRWTAKHRNLKEGDIMLAMEDPLPRGSWPLGRALQVHRDTRGNVRSNKLKMVNREHLRPTSKMCLLLESDIGKV
ncbi:uncharacterized protein LOC135218950 [Macrobrachium nipponense]|uniref:uncharacterized protein LOC135218950 n=1 Tax=Macrobrachium nipponense TaxID=159736 RepID=UPI0030C83516